MFENYRFSSQARAQATAGTTGVVRHRSSRFTEAAERRITGASRSVTDERLTERYCRPLATM